MSEQPRQEPRFLSRDDCERIAQRVSELSTGGGTSAVFIESVWNGNLRWARNMVSTSGDIQTYYLSIGRTIRGAMGGVQLNRIDDASLRLGVQHAERKVMFSPEDIEADLPKDSIHEEHAKPEIWSDATYHMDAKTRAETMRRLVAPSVEVGMLAAGYLEISAHGRGVLRTSRESLYYPYTQAQYSVTVRTPDGSASGWAGVDSHDWNRIDAHALSAIALEKCRTSVNPVRLEPGRYTTILEPQAVCDLTASLFLPKMLELSLAEMGKGPYANDKGRSKIGERIFDQRITVRTDCMDPELGFPPFSYNGTVYYPVTWVEHGVLRELAYGRLTGIRSFGKNHGQPASGAFHMSGGQTSVSDMIATTRRGLLVTRFSQVNVLHIDSMLSSGYTRDGVWLIEDGKIAKAVRNFRFTESPLHVLNNIEQLGVPQRVFRPGMPVIVPPIKVRDFYFAALTDAI